MMLSLEQIKSISDQIDQSAIKIQTLRDDVLDHLCCLTENKMKEGKTFEDSFQESMIEFAPHGLDEIQQETIYLLNSKIIPMKKVIYFIGLATTMSMAMGLMMKLLHMPGGEQLINYGFLGFALLFLPMFSMNNYKRIPNRLLPEKLKVIFGFLSAFTMALAIVFKMRMNLDAAEIFAMAGATLFSFGFLPFMFFGLYKKSVSTETKTT